jgi:putative sigma-54 modulation protein
MDLTEALRDHAEGAIEESLGNFPRIEHIHVILDVQRHLHIAEVVIQGKDRIRVEGKAESDDMYNSIDRAVEKAERQMRKSRDKAQDHKHTEGLGEIEAHSA